jgi:zinc transport system substrate-binding protein
MPRRRLLAALAALAFSAGWVAAADPDRVTVIAGVYPLAEWAARVGGDRVTVTNLTPAGGDPHDFEPTPADLRRLREADVVLTLGSGFQPAVDRALRTRTATQVRLVATQGLALRKPAEGHDGHGHGDDLAYDPHVWLDPVLAKAIVARIAEALARADPAGAPVYAANARAYEARLEALHAKYTRTLASCAHRELVTSHAAFGYLAARYDLHQEAIRGLSPEAEPTPRRLAELAEFVKRHGVRYIFTETVVSPKVAETLARETGARTLVLHTLETLSRTEVAEGKSYLGVMDENLRAIATGLECRAS